MTKIYHIQRKCELWQMISSNRTILPLWTFYPSVFQAKDFNATDHIQTSLPQEGMLPQFSPSRSNHICSNKFVNQLVYVFACVFPPALLIPKILTKLKWDSESSLQLGEVEDKQSFRHELEILRKLTIRL